MPSGTVILRSAWSVIPAVGVLLFAQVITTLEVTLFLADRQRIERELCVMRDKAPEENVCHGQCYLMKRLRALEAEERKPMNVQQVRLDPAVPARVELLPLLPVAQHAIKPVQVMRLLAVPRPPAEPVPWG
ncbi:MAG: hypothetical protein JNM31_01485 [Flavobacteriales bacterium]|nr:hypothetical protein [Flavobacteriales bacterium]